MNVVNISCTIGNGSPILLGTVQASPPNHAFTEAYRDYCERVQNPMDIKEFKLLFREQIAGVRLAGIPEHKLLYTLQKEKIK